jgi:alpha-tubulin suppressor-like RCC1 family protein
MSMGQDFREVSREDLFGIPRELKVSGIVSQIAVGFDHALILTETYILYAMGSNIYGQLGVNRNTGLAYHLHPLTK